MPLMLLPQVLFFVFFSSDFVNLIPHTRSVVAEVLQVSTKDGRHFDADLCIAADGSHSAMRALLVPSEKKRFAGLVWLNVTVQSDFPLTRQALGYVFGDNGSSLYLAPDGINRLTWALSYGVVDEAAALRDVAADFNEVLARARQRVRRDFGSQLLAVVELRCVAF